MIRPVRFPLTIVLTTILLLVAGPAVRAELPPQRSEQATLVVEGLVRESFRSVRATRIDYVYEIEVRSAQAGSTPETPFGGILPRAGELLYVHAFQRRPDAPQVPGPVGYRALPSEQDVVRAYLYPRNGGGWQFAYPLGFERLGRGEALTGPEPTEEMPGSGSGTGAGTPKRLGILVVPAAIGNRLGLQVTAVTPGTPAGRSGLEPGDVILEADGVATRAIGDLTAQVARAGPRLRLLIRNIRTGQLQPFEVDLSAP